MSFFLTAKRWVAVLPVMAAGITLCACSSGGHSSDAAGSTPRPAGSPASGSTTTSDPAESVSAFCTQWSAAKSDLQTMSSTTQLSDARRAFGQVVTDLKAIASPPAAIGGDIQSLESDLEQVNTWLNTQATQADLSGSVPASLAGPYRDVSEKGAAVVSWVKKNCPGS